MAGVRTFEDLDAWRLAVDLRDEIDRMTDTGLVAKDFKFRSQIRDAAASAPRNIAEGWARFSPKENAQFVRWARASIAEVRNHLRHGRTQSYFSQEDFDRTWQLSSRAFGATTRYWQYLDRCSRNRKRAPHGEPRTPNPEP